MPFHLVNFIPFWLQALLDGLALKELVANLNNSVRVRLALNQASEVLILPLQILRFQEVDSEHTLPTHNSQSVTFYIKRITSIALDWPDYATRNWFLTDLYYIRDPQG